MHILAVFGLVFLQQEKQANEIPPPMLGLNLFFLSRAQRQFSILKFKMYASQMYTVIFET